MSKQGQRVILSLRQMIVNGDLAAGERLREESLAERLGVSRTPIRVALKLLAQEGLLQTVGARGYAVRQISTEEIRNAVDVRGVLEGMAARLLAEAGLTESIRDTLKQCLDQGDQLFSRGAIDEGDVVTFHDLNMTFHNTIIDNCGNGAVKSAIMLNDHIPFASVHSIAIDSSAMDREYLRLTFANVQHHLVYDALINRQGTRAESLMREHANAALRYAEIFGVGNGDRGNVKILRSDLAAD
ncbi:GntR family transcriptional regulator [Amphritea pacifica]|uniref:GntR family transcriptional regulator n=1 Tax=Amphritea pacifica TaxID=2811233 RepID=A0ABS2WBM2_9GAMM|nr:GntR family transcriptional regulator [Amphritea pacifica]MBN0989114.1 GntR family transcriptional regulator [Amphritea pacifica]MBN1008598.1 GntR family transcriptional regulator [Amphritea pacifica]